MRWTIAQVAGALGARPGAGLDPVARVAGVSIDSRTIRPGELFIAIHGPRHDGHDHVPAAMDRGAIAAVVADAQLCRYPGEVGERCLERRQHRVRRERFVPLRCAEESRHVPRTGVGQPDPEA